MTAEAAAAEANAPPPSPPSAGKLALRGTVISVGGQLVSQLMRFASNIVLARFLDETAFGLNAMVFTLTTGLWLISDVGIGASVIRSQRSDEKFVNTAWTLSALRGVSLFTVACIAAPIAAWFYGQPQLLWLLPLCSTMVLLLASESMHIYTQQRNMAFGRFVVLDLVSQFAGLAVSIPVAIYTKHVIALALAAVVSAIVKFSLSHFTLPGPRMRFAWDKPAITEIFSFGQWIFISTLFGFFAMRWDVFSLGKLEGFALLGVYGLASQITSVPNQISIQVTNQVLTPVLSDAARLSQDKLRAALDIARRAYMPAGALLFIGAATTAPAFFLIAYKPNFHAAGPMAQVLMFAAWLAFLQEASSRAMLASGDGRGLAFTNGLKVAATMVCTLIGFQLAGFWGFLAGHAASAVVGVVVVAWRLQKQGVSVLAGDIQASLVFLLVLAASCGGPYLVQPLLPGIPATWFGSALPTGDVAIPVAALTLVSCVVVCGPLALIVWRRIKEARAQR